MLRKDNNDLIDIAAAEAKGAALAQEMIRAQRDKETLHAMSIDLAIEKSSNLLLQSVNQHLISRIAAADARAVYQNNSIMQLTLTLDTERARHSAEKLQSSKQIEDLRNILAEEKRETMLVMTEKQHEIDKLKQDLAASLANQERILKSQRDRTHLRSIWQNSPGSTRTPPSSSIESAIPSTDELPTLKFGGEESAAMNRKFPS